MLTARLLLAQRDLFCVQLENFLAVFVSYFSGMRAAAAEKTYQLEKDSYYLKGIVDCILEDARGASSKNAPLVIVDFKTTSNGMPALSDYSGDEGLSDFQLPMYLRLAEAELKKEVHTALFFSIINAEPMVLFGSINNLPGGGGIPKEENIIARGSAGFTAIMGEFEEKVERFAAEISKGSFPVYPEYSELCPECDYEKVCRTPYKICQGKSDGS
jgi:hypothetical protein